MLELAKECYAIKFLFFFLWEGGGGGGEVWTDGSEQTVQTQIRLLL